MLIPELAEQKGEKGEASGRFVVALQDLEPNTEVLNEVAAVFGPKQSSNVVCIECCSSLTSSKEKQFGSYSCSSCNLPVCQPCSSGKFLYHEEECKIFQSNQITFSDDNVSKVYPCITVLRMLIRGVQDLETHVQAREGTPVWVYNEKSVIPFLTSLKDNNGNPLFNKEYIHEVTGALDTNSFQVQDAGVKARAVFPTASLFNNSCKPNCFRVVNRNGISIRTTELVKKGSELTICYTGLLTPTHIRQAVFKHTKHFNCSCPRCLDVTEEGTFPTCLLCSACGGRLEGNSCISCNQSQDAQRIEQISLLCDTLVSRLVQEENCEILTGGLMKLRRLVYPHHYLLVKLKLHFIKHSEKCSTCYDGAARAQCSAEIADLLKIHKIEKTWMKHEEIRGNQETLCSWKSLMAEKKEN